jgi:hypothetical protein
VSEKVSNMEERSYELVRGCYGENYYVESESG